MKWMVLVGFAIVALVSEDVSAQTTPTEVPTPEIADTCDPACSPGSLCVSGTCQEICPGGDLLTTYYDFDDWRVRQDQEEALQFNYLCALAWPDRVVQIGGHTDERNTDEYNQALGQRGADAARDYLIGLGLPAERLRTISYGASAPLCLEHNEACWRLNRAVTYQFQTPEPAAGTPEAPAAPAEETPEPQ